MPNTGRRLCRIAQARGLVVTVCVCDQICFGLRVTLQQRQNQVLQTIAAVLIIMWLLGMATSYTLSGLIHILLILAVVSILVQLVQGRRVV